MCAHEDPVGLVTKGQSGGSGQTSLSESPSPNHHTTKSVCTIYHSSETLSL